MDDKDGVGVITMNSPPVNSLGTSLVTSFKRFGWVSGVGGFRLGGRVSASSMMWEFLLDADSSSRQLRQEFPKLVQDPKAQLGFGKAETTK